MVVRFCRETSSEITISGEHLFSIDEILSSEKTTDLITQGRSRPMSELSAREQNCRPIDTGIFFLQTINREKQKRERNLVARKYFILSDVKRDVITSSRNISPYRSSWPRSLYTRLKKSVHLVFGDFPLPIMFNVHVFVTKIKSRRCTL